jgi:coproporphyrinogen III oxidase-like Fe-S oxidoreductase
VVNLQLHIEYLHRGYIFKPKELSESIHVRSDIKKNQPIQFALRRNVSVIFSYIYILNAHKGRSVHFSILVRICNYCDFNFIDFSRNPFWLTRKICF